MTGFSSMRDMVNGQFTFAPSSNATIATNDLTVSLSSAFTAWYQSTASNQYGSQFTLTVPFSVAERQRRRSGLGDGHADQFQGQLQPGFADAVMNTDARPERTIPGPVIVLPVVVFAAAIVSISAYWLFSKAHSAPGPPPSVAVLPFEGDRLGDGIAAQIIAK